MQLRETDTGLVYASGEPLHVYGEAILIIDLSGGLVCLPDDRSCCRFASFGHGLPCQL